MIAEVQEQSVALSAKKEQITVVIIVTIIL